MGETNVCVEHICRELSWSCAAINGVLCRNRRFQYDSSAVVHDYVFVAAPHFWAIGIRRKEEYRAAGVPLLPVVKGNHVTKIKMMQYIAVLVPITLLFPFLSALAI